MPDALQQIDAALREMQTLAAPSAAPARATRKQRRRWVRWLWLGPLLGTLLAVLPFVGLVRGSVQAYHAFGLGPWPAVGAGLAVTALLLLLYAMLLSWKLFGTVRRIGWLAKALVLIVGLYGGYATLYVSADNVKRPELQATYGELHPLLRLATSTLIVIDPSLVITDGARTSADYVQMGLPVNEHSLHYRQEASGYVHAIDLRTQGRAAWQNRLVQAYFDGMGFRTLRHTGTADHLHVSLPLR